ncbi:MAG: hypothetical protein OEO19_13445 [Gammaproteobacteria bacterium]|nr:hypothetical protein [Gammaproteobacteria bacterium]
MICVFDIGIMHEIHVDTACQLVLPGWMPWQNVALPGYGAVLPVASYLAARLFRAGKYATRLAFCSPVFAQIARVAAG